MKNKILISTLMLLLCMAFLCSYSFATGMMQSAGNAVMNAGNTIGNAAVHTRDTIVGGTQNLASDIMDGVDGMTGDATTTYDTTNDDYTAQRTATANTGLFGMSDTMSTWLIMGIVGAVIIGLIWYYSAQYEHRNYSND